MKLKREMSGSEIVLELLEVIWTPASGGAANPRRFDVTP